VNRDREARVVDFLWLLLPLGVLAAFMKGAEPAGLAVGFALYVVGPLFGGLIMLDKDRSVRAGLLVTALVPIFGLIGLLALENHRREHGGVSGARVRAATGPAFQPSRVSRQRPAPGPPCALT
jgi:hypothetical protein